MSKKNIVFVFADQWRYQATGYAGDPNVKTPNLDKLAATGINFNQATSSSPVCTPYRGSLLTGQFPLTHGLFVNDVTLSVDSYTISDAFKAGGYQTAYIGKWHVDGMGRTAFIPPERQRNFDEWQVCECTHDYNESVYFKNESDTKLQWDGYDAFCQTREACDYIAANAGEDQPFMIMLSWGPPHNPYETAPEEYQAMYKDEDIVLAPNVPEESAEQARKELAGYYAHCTALDKCVGDILSVIEETGIAEDTIFVFTSDHGDMIGSQGQVRKQKPYEESVRVPFLMSCPSIGQGKVIESPIDAPDIMPTLLGLCGLTIPESVEGLDLSGHIMGKEDDPKNGECLIACYHPAGEFSRANGGMEYRGLRTKHYTYVKTLSGPWLLFDNIADPYQLNNLVDNPDFLDVRNDLGDRLDKKLEAMGDEFECGMNYVEKWGYKVDANGTVPYY